MIRTEDAFLPHTESRSVGSGSRVRRVYDSAPEAETTPVVLVPSGALTAGGDYWALLPMIATQHRVVTYELEDSAGAVDHVAGLAEALRLIGHGRAAHIVGFSAGAQHAVTVAGDFPELVSSLTLVAGRLAQDAYSDQVRAVAAGILTEGEEHLRAVLAFSAHFINTRPAADIALLAARTDHAHFGGADLSEWAAKVTAPSLVIAADHDIVNPLRQSHLLFAALADARFGRVASGHQVLTERPSEVFDLVHNFLMDPRATGPGSTIPNQHA